MKIKLISLLISLLFASCVVTNKTDDPLDAASGKSTLRAPGDGTITDSATGLIWKRCPQGQTTSSDDFGAAVSCNGTATLVYYCGTLDDACNGGVSSGTLSSGTTFDSCNSLNTNPAGGFAGKTTWRVPTQSELQSITLNAANNDSAVYNSYFPGVDFTSYFVSSNSISSSNFRAVNANGQLSSRVKTNVTNYLRCVAQ